MLDTLDTLDTLPPDPLAGFDFDTAQREGWTLSETCDLTGKPLVQLQALDRDTLPTGVATLLPSDCAAWDLVVLRARTGSTLHQDALRRLDDIEPALIEMLFGTP